MCSVSDYKAFAAQLRFVPRDEQLRAMQSYLSEIADDSKRKEAARYLVTFPDGNDDSAKTVFVLLHGIRTGGEWQDRIAQHLESEHQITVVPCKYRILNVLSFLIPMFRGKTLDAVERHLNDVCDLYPDSKIVVVAHSFGTWAVAELLKHQKVKVDRLLLCGSVVPQEFNWGAALPGGIRASIVNDVGTKDVWPVVAYALAAGCGASGSLGFGSPRVIDRFHPIGHCDFFSDAHVRQFWVPFLIEGRVISSPHTETRPPVGFWKGLLCSLPNGAALWAVVVAMMGILVTLI